MELTGPVTLQALGQVATSVGLSACLVLFFVWQNWNREKRVADEFLAREKLMLERENRVIERLQSLEDFTRSTLMSALTDNSKALGQMAQTSDKCVTAIERLHQDLQQHHQLAVEIAKKLG